jgi:uncharacterized phage protein (TIGR02218 family)
MSQLRRDVPTELQALFDSGKELIKADLMTITLSGGQVMRWTDHDRLVTIAGTTWQLGAGFTTGRMKWSAGVEVDTQNISLYADGGTTINGVPALHFINGGGFDAARFDLWRAFTDDVANGWVGKLHRFSGKVSDIDRPTKVEALLTLRSVFELFNQQLPKNVHQPTCDLSVYSTPCGVSRASKTVYGTVTGGSDPRRLSFTDSGLTQPDGYFSLGGVRGTSGANAGVLRTVRSSAAGVVTVVQPWPLPVAIGDTFAIYPGCDGTRATCRDKFENVIRFRGEEWIPSAETVL